MNRESKKILISIFISLLLLLFTSYQVSIYSQEDYDEGESIDEESDTGSDQQTSLKGEEEDPFFDIFKDPEISREPGLPGMNISELELLGIAKVKGQYEAVIRGIDKKPYRLQVNQRLRDGYVQRVSDNEIVYMQKVDDPVVKDKYTPIIKRLREEVK